jgi:septal ring factor EnvC (AmiA/AmiB activator)
MTYAEITHRLESSRQRMQKLLKKVDDERKKQTDLLLKMSDNVSSVTQSTVKIGRKNHNPDYNRDEIVDRIIFLREQENKSFSAIAAILNAEGYKPRTAKSFAQATVFQLYNGAVKSVALAVAIV